MPCRDNPITEPSCAETAVGTYLVTLVHLVAGEPVKCSALSLKSRPQLVGETGTPPPSAGPCRLAPLPSPATLARSPGPQPPRRARRRYSSDVTARRGPYRKGEQSSLGSGSGPGPGPAPGFCAAAPAHPVSLPGCCLCPTPRHLAAPAARNRLINNSSRRRKTRRDRVCVNEGIYSTDKPAHVRKLHMHSVAQLNEEDPA
ncbi:uncharacterized protein LOC141575513 [Camelus bactrianus]|uniref:Uncharacterized protein LOC141575513 n=1 Tax=Camelus bactrianus TaxID=9837 RepID=A0AC58PLQ4_CAMBA|nr:uncharacterized protein LOC116149663 [Camelus dromedarius]